MPEQMVAAQTVGEEKVALKIICFLQRVFFSLSQEQKDKTASRV